MFENKQTEASGGFTEIPFPAYNNNVSQSPFHRNMTAGRDQMLPMGSNSRQVAAASSSSSFSGFRDLIQQCGGPLAQFPGYDHPCPRGHMLGGQMASAAADLSSPGFNGPPDARLPPQHYLQQILMNGPASFEAANACKMTTQEIVEAKALAASKSHSEAERRRRERINTHLATLRSLLPSTTKTDKASLLAEVIEHVKELKRHAADLAQGSPVPSECDELSVDTSCNEEGRLLIKASLCCDDRPDLLSDLIKTLRTLRLRAVKAEIATLGGRVKNVFVVTNGCPSSSATADQHHHQHPDALEESSGHDFQENPSVTCIQEALKAVMERQNSGEFSPAGTSNSAPSKRQRLGQFGASLRILDDPSF